MDPVVLGSLAFSRSYLDILNIFYLSCTVNDPGNQLAKEEKKELKAEKGKNGCALVPEEEKPTGSSSQAQIQQEASVSQVLSPAALTTEPQTPQKPPVIPPCPKKRHSTVPAQDETPSTVSAASEHVGTPPVIHNKKSPSTETRSSTRERNGV